MLPSSVVLVALLLSSAAPQFARPFVRAEQVPGTLIAAEGGRITVLDARDEKAFRRGHLEGAVRVDWTQLRRGVLARRLPAREGRLPEDLDELARDFAALGVDAERPVLVCGAGSSGWGEEGRIAWMLRYLGHKDVAVLDGGCQAWGRAGRPLVRTLTRPSRGRFLARPDEDLRASLAEVEAATGQLLDVRSAAEYRGATPYHSARGGHVPGARHLEWKAFLDEQTGRVKDGDAVRKLLREAGVDPARPVITYCTGGVRSGFVALVLEAAGVRAANYDGSWWEWAGEERLPVER